MVPTSSRRLQRRAQRRQDSVSCFQIETRSIGLAPCSLSIARPRRHKNPQSPSSKSAPMKSFLLTTFFLPINSNDRARQSQKIRRNSQPICCRPSRRLSSLSLLALLTTFQSPLCSISSRLTASSTPVSAQSSCRCPPLANQSQHRLRHWSYRPYSRCASISTRSLSQ